MLQCLRGGSLSPATLGMVSVLLVIGIVTEMVTVMVLVLGIVTVVISTSNGNRNNIGNSNGNSKSNNNGDSNSNSNSQTNRFAAHYLRFFLAKGTRIRNQGSIPEILELASCVVVRD